MMAAVTESGALRGELLFSEPMSRHTSWRVGGAAQRFYRPRDLDDLSVFMATIAADEPIHWLGLGSNVLVLDGGLSGTVVCTSGVLSGMDVEENGQLRVGAGVPTAQMARFCARHGLLGCEFMAGIPGTLGGALAMNAGALGHETWDRVLAVQMMDRQGGVQWRTADAFTPGYRHVSRAEDEWFVAAVFQFEVGDSERSMAAIRACLRRRAETQPSGQACCGSVFRNPPGDHAGRLIESAGLKGHRMGGASVSMSHANFIVNDADACARDIESLVAHIQQVVEARFGVRLVPEFHVMGHHQEDRD